MANSISNLLPKNGGSVNNMSLLMGSKPMNSSLVNPVKGMTLNPSVPNPAKIAMGKAQTTPLDGYSSTPALISKTPISTNGATGGNATSTPVNTNTQSNPIHPIITAGNQQNTPGTNSLIKPANPVANPSSSSGLVGRVAGAGNPTNAQTQAIQNINNTAAGNAQIGQDARAIANKYSNEIDRVGGLGASAQAGDLSTGTHVVGAGNAAIASQSAAQHMQAYGTAEQAALQGIGQQLIGQSQQANAYNNALSGANTQQGQTINALGTAAGLTQPIQVPYSNQLVNPQTGESIGGAGGSLQSAVANIQQKLQAGQMSYDDAKAALSGYGQGGLDALNQSLPPGFNVAQSNVNAQQQGAVGPALTFATTALQNVKSIMSQLPDMQNTNIPILNALTRGASTATGIGSEQTRALTGAIQSLKNAYAALLASSKGGTPTDYSSQASAEIPDNPTLNDIAAVEKNMQVLGQARQAIYGNAGMSQGGSNIPEGSINWENLLD